jgi:biopolymer transport protein ExbD
MAGVSDVGTQGKRKVNSDINMIPFIDLLMVTIAFLLITAVWVTHSRLETSAKQPDVSDGPVQPVTPTVNLHIMTQPTEFVLVWKQGETVVHERRVPRTEAQASQGYPDLAAALSDEWKRRGGHQDPSDPNRDRCVFHSDNAMSFREMVAVMDAIHAARRQFVDANGQRSEVPAFDIALAK